MKLLAIAIVAVAIAGPGRVHADDKLKPYAGHVVMSPDTPPTTFDKLPEFLAANLAKDDTYELIKWDVNFVGVLAKATDKVTLEVRPAAEPKKGAKPDPKKDPKKDDAKPDEPLVSIALTVNRLVVIGHFAPTKAAGFAAGGHYAVTLTAGKTVVAHGELVLRQ